MPIDQRDREETVARQRASMLKAIYTDARQVQDLESLSQIISLDDMQKHRIVPLLMTSHDLVLGFTQSTPRHNINQVKAKLSSFNLRFNLISDSGYKELLDRYTALLKPPRPPDHKQLADRLARAVLEAKQTAEDPDLFTKKLADTSQKDLIQLIAQQAYLINSSDIHIEPTRDVIRLRFRIDGVLHQVATLAPDRFNLLLSVLQMHSGIRWNANYPQTGHMTAELVNHNGDVGPVNMRVETTPTNYGSDIVIRIFNLDVSYLNLDHIGLSQRHHQAIEELIKHPHGLGLITGPTGSGKTSTLYAILNRLNTPEVKIITLEDPIEYELGGLTQLAVDSNQGQSFGERLRAVLREDPDIIMVGEIRDPDTAKTSLQSALTGHLVLSTFHANSAAGAVSRLMDMIGANPMVASALKLVMTQRLLRKLCEHCKQADKPGEKELEQIKNILETLPEGQRPDLEKAQLYRSKGCDKCYHIGYKGRLMVAEQLIMSPAVEQLIASFASSQQIHSQAVKEGMITILQDGVLKALDGLTTLEEVFRVLET